MLAQAPAGADAPAPLFDSHEPLAITLEGPFREIANDKAEEPEYSNAVLHIDGTGIPVRIRARGKNRRNPETCSFPPLRLNFEKESVAETVFAGQNKLKLVTHCQRATSFQQYILREYLAYRFYNQITDYSFRVRLLEVTYIDSAKSGRSVTRSAFLIEDRDEMAKRNGAKVVKVESIGRHDLEPEVANLHELFQFMIGNTDWSALFGPEGDLCCHNTVLIKAQGSRHIIPVPYDFDNSGLVNAPYAEPGIRLPIRSVTERLYRGFCRPDEVVMASVERFREQRPAMQASIDNQAGLTKGTRKTLTRYLNGFFKTVDDETKRERAIEGNCR